MLVQQRFTRHRGQALVLQIVPTGIGCAAQQKSPFAFKLQIRRDRVKPHEGRQRNGIGTVALKRLNGILLSGAADVAALGIQNDGHLGRDTAHVLHQALKLAFSPVRREVGDLWLERDDQIRRGVHNGRTEVINLVGVALESTRKPGGFGVEPDAQHG